MLSSVFNKIKTKTINNIGNSLSIQIREASSSLDQPSYEFYSNMEKQINYTRCFINICNKIFTEKNIQKFKNLSTNQQQEELNRLLVKVITDGPDISTNTQIISILFPKYSVTKNAIIKAFQSNNLNLNSIKAEEPLNLKVSVNFIREFDLLLKFNQSNLISKTIRNENIASNSRDTIQTHPDYVLNFENFNTLFSKYADGKHGTPKVEDSTTITQTSFNTNTQQFTGILTTDKHAETYIKEISSELTELKDNSINHDNDIFNKINHMQKNLISNWDPITRIKKYEDDSITLLSIIQQKNLNLIYNPKFLHITEANYSNLPEVDKNNHFFSHHTKFHRLTTLKSWQKISSDYLYQQHPKIVNAMRETRGTLLEPSLALMEDITIKL